MNCYKNPGYIQEISSMYPSPTISSLTGNPPSFWEDMPTGTGWKSGVLQRSFFLSHIKWSGHTSDAWSTISLLPGMSNFSLATVNTYTSPKNYDCVSHVLTAAPKFLRAYNVKSSSTLLADKIPWIFMIYFPCVRFISQLGYKLIA